MPIPLSLMAKFIQSEPVDHHSRHLKFDPAADTVDFQAFPRTLNKTCRSLVRSVHIQARTRRTSEISKFIPIRATDVGHCGHDVLDHGVQVELLQE